MATYRVGVIGYAYTRSFTRVAQRDQQDLPGS